MINNNIRRKRKRKHNIYTKKAFLKNKINWKNININDLIKDSKISKEKFSQQYLCEWV